jgi:uroporphyrinogen III methyltransferase/synthase
LPLAPLLEYNLLTPEIYGNEASKMHNNAVFPFASEATPGTVYLIGAGPGDPDLITVKGLNILRQADVVLYDYLANPVLLSVVPPDAEKLYVGKSAGSHALPQQEINRLLVQYARSQKIVVRLKGGDPFVFGRGGEEALYLAQHGIPWQVVPGVTSAVAVPAYAGIPVTHRGYAASFTVVTGHTGTHPDNSYLDWSTLARLNTTLIILMGLGNLAFIVDELTQHGRPGDTPIAVIQWGTLPEQHAVTGTLNTIVERVKAAQVRPPALIVVGHVVDLAQHLRWFSADADTPS